MQTHNKKRLLSPILDSGFIIVGVLLLVLGISVLSRPVEAAGCRSSSTCGFGSWDVYAYGCDAGCLGCSTSGCCYYEVGQCIEYPYAMVNFRRCGMDDCTP